MTPNFINQKYSVIFDKYSENCFEKVFKRKYKSNWDATKQSINDSLERIFNLSKTSYLDIICVSNKDTYLAKYDFKVAKTNVSAKSSGNRCIVEICNKSLTIRVLLIYCKQNLGRKHKQETLWWKEHVSSSIGLYCV